MENRPPPEAATAPKGPGRPPGSKNKPKQPGTVKQTKIHPDARPLAPLFQGARDHQQSKGIALDQQGGRFKKGHALPSLTREQQAAAVSETARLARIARDNAGASGASTMLGPAPAAPRNSTAVTAPTATHPLTVEMFCEQRAAELPSRLSNGKFNRPLPWNTFTFKLPNPTFRSIRPRDDRYALGTPQSDVHFWSPFFWQEVCPSLCCRCGAVDGVRGHGWKLKPVLNIGRIDYIY